MESKRIADSFRPHQDEAIEYPSPLFYLISLNIPQSNTLGCAVITRTFTVTTTQHRIVFIIL